MQQLALPRLSRWIPLVLLGSLPCKAVAGEQFFPVLLDSGAHWFSFLDGMVPPSATQSLQSLALSPGSSVQVLRAVREQEAALEQASDNAYDGSNMENLGRLARLLRESGRHHEAFEKMEQQYFLARVTRGLHDERHIPLLQELAELAQLKGDMARAHDLREALLNLSLRVYDEDDPARIDAYLQWADWQLQCYLESAADPWLLQAFDQNPWFNPCFTESDLHYRRALKKLEQHQVLPITTRMSLLLAMRRWQALHLVAARRLAGLPAGRANDGMPHSAAQGQPHLPLSYIGYITETMRQSTETGSEPQGDELQLRVVQLMLLGDWLHTIALPEQAQQTYAEAYELLQQGELPPQRAQQLLGPGLPVPDPEQWYHSQRSANQLRGHLDASVTLDAEGQLLGMEFHDAGAAETARGRALARHLAGSRFRPPYGPARATHTVKLRFYHH